MGNVLPSTSEVASQIATHIDTKPSNTDSKKQSYVSLIPCGGGLLHLPDQNKTQTRQTRAGPGSRLSTRPIRGGYGYDLSGNHGLYGRTMSFPAWNSPSEVVPAPTSRLSIQVGGSRRIERGRYVDPRVRQVVAQAPAYASLSCL